MSRRGQYIVGPLARVACLASVGAALEGSRRALPAPSVLSIHGGALWWDRLGPVTATFAVLRLALLAVIVIWLVALVGSLAVVVMVWSGLAAPVRVREMLAWSAARPWRRLLVFALGLSVSTGSLAACGGTGARSRVASGERPAVPAAPVLVGPPAEMLAGPPSGAVAGPPSGAVAGPPSGAVPAVARPGPAAPRPRTAAASVHATPGPGTWVVRPGDDFWSIAEAVLARQNTESQPSVGRYWAALVAANKDRLPVPGDPDLLFPGDRILLPPLGGAAG